MEEICKENMQCGACKYIGLNYKKQLELKTKYVEGLFNKNFKFRINVNKTLGMSNPLNYRNKGKFAFGLNKKKEPVMGFFKEGTHEIIPFNDCIIQNNIINKVAKYIFEIVKRERIPIYQEDKKKGFLRHLIIRYGVKTNEVMVIFVTVNQKMNKSEKIVKELINEFPNIRSIVQNINEKQTNAILGVKNYNLYGNGYIVDYLNGYKFKISPLSFYQVNPIQTEVLYNTAIDAAEINKNDVVFDLYSGIGTISISVSDKARKVYGIEVVTDAVADAKANAKLNRINNVEFISGKVEEKLEKLARSSRGSNTIIVDPPRMGMDQKTIDTLLKIQSQKLIYISCNPETLVNDVKQLSKIYKIIKVQPVDMFPYTEHVECVAVLNLK